MFFSLHSMTCSISSLGGIMSGGDFVLPKIGGAFVRGGFCPGGILSGGILSRGDFVLDSTSAGANAAVWLHRKRACINFTEPRSQCKGDCNARPDVSRRSISLNTHRNTARRPNSNALCKKPVQYQRLQFRHSI